MTTSWVSAFGAGDGARRSLLGGKGAGLAEMTKLGLAVPPGFTVTTEASRYVMQHGTLPDDLWDQVGEAMAGLERQSGRTFGGGPAPLLVSVRSGAVVSMPGMMDTVLNLGINDDVVDSLISWSDDAHFAYDAYRRFIQMYADVVLGLDEHPYETALSQLRERRGVPDDSQLTAEDLEEAVAIFKKLVTDEGASIPADVHDQLHTSIEAVFNSWNNPRADSYRRINNIPHDLGTAANVQMMVFGDLGENSGTGVCFTRDPSTGAREPYGDYLPRAQGEDVVAGTRNTLTLDDLGGLLPDVHAELLGVMDGLEQHTTDMADIEFTVERGKLWMLQTRAGKRTAAAAVKIAVDMVHEGLIDRRTALLRVEPAQLEQLERLRIDVRSTAKAVATGVAASPGAAQGEAVFDADSAVAAARAGKRVVLIRQETTPNDIHGMDAADGILTSQGGKTSHAAVVARGMGKPAVTGAAGLFVNVDAKFAHAGDVEIREGDPVTIDGTTGAVYPGLLPLVDPEETFELQELMEWADKVRKLGVRANADTPTDAAKSRAAGAEGIGLARTEHMFMGERLAKLQHVILADDHEDRERALAELRQVQTEDFEGLLESMDGLPVVVRLLDPPLHEFLPSVRELQHQQLERAKRGENADELVALQKKVDVWSEHNPMLGLRGVRLGLMLEHLYLMQTEAAVQAVVRRLEAGGDPRLEIMIPLVSTVEELNRMRTMIEGVIVDAAASAGRELHIPIGTMIELPRAALTAGRIAEAADFFSFGTNDLTQMTFGLSRDDAEGLFLRDYLEQEILEFDPFQTLDVEGVGRLIRAAVRDGREAKASLDLGLCGEHGGDPASIAFCQEVGLDYVSCSPPRVPVARLAAAQAAIRATDPL